MVFRLLAVPDWLLLHELDAVFRAVLGGDNIGFLFRVHGQEFHSFRRATGCKTLREFPLRPSESFLYTCGAVDLWEWEIRLLDEEPGSVSVDAPRCLGGRGAAPPQPGGGPTGYRLMLKRPSMGEAMGTPVQREAAVGMWAASDPEAPPETWRCYRQILQEGFASLHRRLQEYGPRETARFHLEEANRRLAQREDFMGRRRAGRCEGKSCASTMAANSGVAWWKWRGRSWPWRAWG
jgi:hypothetical protein